MKVNNPKEWTKYITAEAKYFIPEECNGGLAIDCGCNVGAFVLNNHNKFDKFICFDILEENLEILKNNLLNKNINYECEKRACFSESNKSISVYAHSQSDGSVNYFGNSGNVGIKLFNNGDNKWGWNEENKIDEVKTITIEEILEKYSPVKLLKVDIEGSEYDFLMNKNLNKIEYIVGEMHFLESQQTKELIEYISKTHDIIDISENCFCFRLKNDE